MFKKKIHLKDKLKQLTALALSLLMCTTAFPVSTVYATRATSGVNVGSPTSHGTPSSSPDKDFGDFCTEGVRVYIYDKEEGTFITSDSSDSLYNGAKAIDFLGYDGVYNFYRNNVSNDDVDLNTMFGTLHGSDLAISDAWPFTKDGTDYYFANYELDSYDWEGNQVHNYTLSGTKYTDEMLKENNGETLDDIITDYWGESVYRLFRTSPNLMFCVEPIFIVSEAYGEPTEDENAYPNHFQSGTIPATIEKSTYIYNIAEEQYSCMDEKTYKFYPYGSSGGAYDAYYRDITTEEYKEMYALMTDEEKEEYDNTPGIFCTEKVTWSEETTLPVYRGYKYVYGTARTMYERSKTEEFAWNYDIADAVCNAVFNAGVGDNGEYNKYYDIIFPDDGAATKPTYQGNENCSAIGETQTTWGFFFLASREFGDCIWHTQDTQSSITKPSGAPISNGEGYPNESDNYGSEIVVKIYEDVNKNTGEVVKLQTFLTSDVPSTIELETEIESRKVYESCGEPGHDKCRTWINWISENRDSISECANTEYGEDEGGKYIVMPATGYTLEDWCTGERDGALASEMQRQGWSSNTNTYKIKALDGTSREIDTPVWKDYTYEGQTRTLKKSSSGKGPTTITIGGNSQTDKSQSPSDDNIVYMRLVKYVDGSGNTPVETNNDSVLTQSYLSNTASVNNLLSQDKSPQTFSFTDRALSGDSLYNDSLSLSAGIDVSAGRYVDLTLGQFNYNYNFTRPSTDSYKTNLGRQGQYFIIRRDSDSIKGIATGINVFNIDKKSGEWGNSEVTTPNGLISGIYGYDTDQVSYDNSEDNLNAGLSESAWSNEFGTSLKNTSSDNYTASNTDESWTGLATTLDTANAKTGIEEFKTTQSTKSSIVQNNSDIEGSTQVTNSKTIRPIVKMQYSLINENGDNRDIERKEVYVTSPVTRTFNVNSYAGIQMSNINGENLIVSSNMFSIDAMLTSGKENEGDWQLPGRVLKGGAAYSLSSENPITVNMTTVQLLEDDSNNYDSSNYVSFYSDSSYNITQENHTEFKDEAINNLKETYIAQYLSDSIKDIRTPAYDDGIKISGSQEDIYSEDKGFNHTNPYTSTELQSDSKYWLSQEKQTGNSAYFDVTDEKTEANYYKFISSVSGDIYMITSSDKSFPSNKTTVVRILKQNEGIEQLSNQTAILLNKQTNVLDNMLSVIARGVGNDTNNTWSDGTHYYNEYSETTLVRYNTSVRISLQYPNKRTAVIDTHLQPESSSRLDTGSLAFKTAFKTNWSDLQEMSKFRGKSVYLKNADVMLHSKQNIFVPNMSVQDNV